MMELKNKSHRSDEYVLKHFHWCRRQMGVRDDAIRLLVCKTRSKRCSWRGRWTRYYGWGDKIRVAVSKFSPTTSGRAAEAEEWVKAFSHELWHSTGASEKACQRKADEMVDLWRKKNG